MRERPEFRADVEKAEDAWLNRIIGDVPPDWGKKVAKARATLADTDVRGPDVVSAPSDDRT
jgi:hypothetical protein